MTLQNKLNSFFKTENHIDKFLANQNARQRYASKKLAKKLNVNLDISRDSYGWNCWVEAEEKYDDGMFCTSWAEVITVLEFIEIERGK